MTLVTPLNYARVIHSMAYAGDSEPMAITYGIETNSGADVAAVATSMHTAFSPVMAGFPTVVSLASTTVYLQSSAPPADPVIGVAVGTVAGTDARAVVPQNTAYLVHKRSAVAGRAGRGRLYLPGVAEAAVNAVGQVDPGQVSGYQALLTTWLAAIASALASDGMVVLHDSDGAYSAASPYPVTSLVMDNRVATQRQRLRR